jgi:hypothetical protein
MRHGFFGNSSRGSVVRVPPGALPRTGLPGWLATPRPLRWRGATWSRQFANAASIGAGRGLPPQTAPFAAYPSGSRPPPGHLSSTQALVTRDGLLADTLRSGGTPRGDPSDGGKPRSKRAPARRGRGRRRLGHPGPRRPSPGARQCGLGGSSPVIPGPGRSSPGVPSESSAYSFPDTRPGLRRSRPTASPPTGGEIGRRPRGHARCCRSGERDLAELEPIDYG